MLPPDSHVHTEWSWDAPRGSMEQACARAEQLGLASVAFTEHAEFAPAKRPGGYPRPGFRGELTATGELASPVLYLPGYLESVQRCREKFPGLRILTGVELSEPHWHPGPAAKLLAEGGFDRVLASVHSLQASGVEYRDTGELYIDRSPADVVRAYLAEVSRLIDGSDGFAVLAHIDYPVRSWPGGYRQFDPAPLEEEFRAVLRPERAGPRLRCSRGHGAGPGFPPRPRPARPVAPGLMPRPAARAEPAAHGPAANRDLGLRSPGRGTPLPAGGRGARRPA
jgi:histidinol-phosphatase (PHP family)